MSIFKSMSQPYTTYRSYIRERFKKPVLKVPVNGGFSCPNRDGTKSSEGCIFCDNRSFSPAACDVSSVLVQLGNALSRARKHREYCIAYLQPFTNTYGTIEQLKAVYEPVIALPDVIGLAVGTRPDCLSEEICDYLAEVARRTYLSVEIGLQSTSDTVLDRNNRGHTYGDFLDAVARLARRNIETVAHVMIGLPGDSWESVMTTAQELAGLPVHGIKIHQLMIIRGTKMEEWYTRGEVEPLSIEAYAKYAGNFICYLRPDQYIHRIMADSKPEHGLLAPLWSAEKIRSVQYIKQYMQANGLFQGKRWKEK